MDNTNVDLRRSFDLDDEGDIYFIGVPTAENIRGADWQYSKTYTTSLVEGITTSAEMMDILMRRGIIGPEFEQRAKELIGVLNYKINKLEETTDMDLKRTLAVEVAMAREEVFQWNQRLNGPMSNTCEQIADDARLEFLTSCIIQKEDVSRVWSTFDAYKSEKNQQLAMKARFETMLYLQGLDSNFLENTPEAVAMREVETSVLDKARDAMLSAKAISEEILAKEEQEKAKELPKKLKTTKIKNTDKKINVDKI